MESLASIIGMETHQTLLVNSIVDFSSFCTSIVARMSNGTIVHARNLDFDFPSIMSKLVYKAIYVKNNTVIAEAPGIAGYLGAYTGLKKGAFTITYNVRFLDRTNFTHIQENLDMQAAGYLPTAQIIQ
jgi:hypothetical protein